MAAKTEKVIEAIEPVVEEVVEDIETLSRIPKLWLNGTTRKQQILILSATALVGAAAGTGLSLTVLKKRLQLKYEQLAQEEIADAKEFYASVHKPELSDVAKDLLPKSELVENAAQAVKSYGGHDLVSDPRTAVKVPESTTQNIFVDGAPMDVDTTDFDYEAEIAQRSEAAPYIISKDEWAQGEKDYDQVELTYFAGDDVLADDKSKHIPDSDDVVGDLNLHRFGYGSGDNNILYVRNDRLEQDYVVVKSDGEYTKEVLGLRHSDTGRHAGSRKERRFRGDDG